VGVGEKSGIGGLSPFSNTGLGGTIGGEYGRGVDATWENKSSPKIFSEGRGGFLVRIYQLGQVRASFLWKREKA